MVFKTGVTGSSPVPFVIYTNLFNIFLNMEVKRLRDINMCQLLKLVDLIIPAKNAKLGPPVGPALSQTKMKVNDFCLLFNQVSSKFEDSFPLRVRVVVFKNKSFNFFIKTPSIYFLLDNIRTFYNRDYIYLYEIYKIAKIKSLEFDYISLKILIKNILNITKLYSIKIIIK